MLEAVPPDARGEGRLRGRAEVGTGTVGRVAWDLAGVPGRTRVVLSATVERATRFDRLVLALGGRLWLQRLFLGAVEALERELTAAPRA